MKVTMRNNHVLIKLIAIILIAASFMEDIAYANVDALAASSFFHSGASKEIAYVAYLEGYIQSSSEFQANPSLSVIDGILQTPEVSDWMLQNEIIYEPQELGNDRLSEIIIRLSSQYLLRYYDKRLSPAINYFGTPQVEAQLNSDSLDGSPIIRQIFKLDASESLSIESDTGAADEGSEHQLSKGRSGLWLLAAVAGVSATLVGAASSRIAGFMRELFPHDRRKPNSYMRGLIKRLLPRGVSREYIRKLVKLVKDQKKFTLLKDAISIGSFDRLRELALEDVSKKDLSLNPEEVSDFLEHNVFVIRDVSLLPDKVVEALSVLGTFNVPGIVPEGSEVSGIAVIFYDSMANNILNISDHKKRDYAIKELWGAILSEFLALKYKLGPERRMSMVSKITGVSEEHIKAFRSRKKMGTSPGSPVSEASRLGDMMHVTAKGAVYFISDVHGSSQQLPPALAHIKGKGAIMVDCGDLGSSSDNAPPDSRTMEIFFSASDNLELFDCLKKGGEDLRRYARAMNIEEKYILMAESRNYEEQIEFFRRLFDAIPIKDVLAVEGVHTDSKSLLDMYLELHPEVLIIDNMGVVVRHNLSYPTLDYTPDPESPGKVSKFYMQSSEAMLFPPNFTNITVSDTDSIEALDGLFSFRQKGHAAARLAVVGHCHPEKPMLFRKIPGVGWVSKILTEGSEVIVEDQTVLVVPALRDAYRKAYIPYARQSDGNLIIGCDAVDMVPNGKVAELARYARIDYGDDYINPEEEDRIFRLIGQSWITIKIFMSEGEEEIAGTMIRACFIKGILWEEMGSADIVEATNFIQEHLDDPAIKKETADPKGKVNLSRLVGTFRDLLVNRAASSGQIAGEVVNGAALNEAVAAAASHDTADKYLESLMSELRGIARPDVNAPILPSGSRVLLSESLFSLSPEDRENLNRLISNTGIEILSAGEIRIASTAKPAKTADDGAGRKLVCVLSKDDYDKEKLGSEAFIAQNRAKLLVLNADLKDCRYAYLGGIIGLARAVMNDDKEAIERCLGLMFSTDIDDKAFADLLLEDPRRFADHMAFKEIKGLDTNVLSEKHMRESEMFLESA